MRLMRVADEHDACQRASAGRPLRNASASPEAVFKLPHIARQRRTGEHVSRWICLQFRGGWLARNLLKGALHMSLASLPHRSALIAVLLLGWTAPVRAQPGGAQSMSLQQALDYARAHHPQVRSALAELAARKAEAKVPRAQWMPQIGGTLQVIGGSVNNTTASYLNVPEVDLPRIGGRGATTSTDWTPAVSTMAALSVGQEVYDFGRIAAQISVADAHADVARANADSIDLTIQLGVEEAYHGVLAAKAVLHATEEALKRATTHRDYAQAGTKSGMRPPIDLTRAQADVATLDVRRIRATAGLQAARAALAASIGSTAIEVDAEPLADDQTPGPAFDEALRIAAQRNPAIAAALARVRAQTWSTKEITRELLPNLFASAGLNGRAGGMAATAGGPTAYGDGWLPDIANWHLGLVLQWNLFDGTVLARREASKAREQAMQADLELERMVTALGAEKSWLDLDAALRALPGLAQAVAAAQANQQQADARFRAGLGTIIELADAEALLTNAQLELAVGQFTVARARAVLARMMGQPTPQNGKRP
jgi:outer membrane protein TolC